MAENEAEAPSKEWRERYFLFYVGDEISEYEMPYPEPKRGEFNKITK